jgi:hypothetical protein
MNRKFSLGIEIDDENGQLLSLCDDDCSMDILRYAQGNEIEINGKPLNVQHIKIEEDIAEHITNFVIKSSTAYGAGNTLNIRRVITRGGMRLHSGPSQSLHIRYDVSRIPHTEIGEGLDYIWQPEIEAPLQIETIGVLCAPALWFGEKTRMKAIAIGGSGPRDHVSIEDGPVAEVAPYLQRKFRTTFPGQQMVSGALYYHPDDERFVWVIARRPTTAGHIEFGEKRHAYQYYYFTEMCLQKQLTTPAVSFFWGQGLDNAETVLAQQFDMYQEPPAWWYKTSWFWMHPNWQSDASFETMGQGAEILMDECGVNGFGMFVHDVPWSGNDCDIGSPNPNPSLGGSTALGKAVEKIRNKGGHTYAWISRHGHRPDSMGWQDSWGIYGVDGRRIKIKGAPDRSVSLDIINPSDPSFQDYIMGWIKHYVSDLGITGLFWDSGLQPLPPDFGNKPYLRWPGETSARAAEFYDKIYRFGKSLDDDFFMWVEGIGVDIPMNAFAVDSRNHGGGSGHALMQRIANRGPKRLVWRSAWQHDVASGFPFIYPMSDICASPDVSTYKTIAADPMNRWICQIVKERGIRHAIGLGDGFSMLDEFIIASPGISGKVVVPPNKCIGNTAEHVITREKVTGKQSEIGIIFDLPASGGYIIK